LTVAPFLCEATAFATWIDDPFVDHAVAVVILPVADFLRPRATDAARIEEPLVHLPITVIVLFITDLRFTNGVRRQANHRSTGIVTGCASIDKAGPFADEADLTQLKILVRLTVTVIVDTIAALLLAWSGLRCTLDSLLHTALKSPLSKAGADAIGTALAYPQLFVYEGIAVVI